MDKKSIEVELNNMLYMLNHEEEVRNKYDLEERRDYAFFMLGYIRGRITSMLDKNCD